jgi:hypothetical protein
MGDNERQESILRTCATNTDESALSRKYQKPVLKSLGSINDITQGESRGSIDGIFGGIGGFGS